VTLGRFVETVPSDQTSDACIDRAFHQHKSWKLANILFARHIGNDFFHSDMAAREQYKRGILQIYEDDIGVGCLESSYGIGENFFGIVSDATPDRIVATKLPHHQIRPVTQDIVVKAGDVVRDVLHNAPAIDELDPRGGV
jgi:hypothetical protein